MKTKKEFIDGVFVNVRLGNEQGSTKKISDLNKMLFDENRYPIQEVVIAGATYIAFHTKEDAKRIEEFLNEK